MPMNTHLNSRNKPFGHFSEDGREYVITEPFAPPRAQVCTV